MKRLGLLVTAVAVSAFIFGCLGLGKDQHHEMLQLDFSPTAVCNAQPQEILLQNDSNETVIIEGAAISGGTDPLRNFRVISVTVGSEVIQSINGAIDNVTIPPNTYYSFQISYVPQKVSSSDTAILDIAYSQPAGVTQVTLSGSSPRTSENCPQREVNREPIDEEDILTGEMTVIAEKLIALESIQGNTITSDQGEIPFSNPTLSLLLDKDAGTLELRAFTDGSFILPQPGERAPVIIRNNFNSDTIITMVAPATGTYDASAGELTIGDLVPAVIHMAGDLEADLPIVLTTGELEVSGVFSSLLTWLPNLDNLDNLPGHIDTAAGTIFGTPIQEDGSVVLVGLSDPTVFQAPNIMQGQENALKLAVLIQARIERVETVDDGTETGTPVE